MPSPEHAADLERVLARAAEECESGAAWFGEGLPRALKNAMETAGRVIDSTSADVAFVDAGEMGSPPAGFRVVALSTAGLEDLASLIRTTKSASVPIARLICPIAVLDFTPDGLRVREIKHGLTAADLQGALDVTLWSGPDLKELGLEIEPFGGNTFVVKAAPVLLAAREVKPLVVEIVEKIAEIGAAPGLEEALDKCRMIMACHGAIRANQALSESQIKGLLHQLDDCQNPSHCPHGRPTWLRWELRTLEKSFKRIV